MTGNIEQKYSGEIRTRIAPSPTGYLHVGNARTALFSYLFAKKEGGNFVLRIEDTDLERSKKEYADDVIKELKWLGLDWAEGPDVGGKYGPYLQTERLELYSKYLNKLLEEGKAYYCFCSHEELEVQRQYQMSQGMAPKYNGKCSNLSKEEVEKNLKEGKPCVIRLRAVTKKIILNDLIKGKVEFDTGLIGDIVIAKSLTMPLYNFAVVIDDYEMKISHVIRGDDHLSNTPKQILIQEALGLPKPLYAHLPMILGADRSKMSKRHGDTSVLSYRQAGYLPEALVNFLAFLGWNPGDEREIYSLASLSKEFTLEKVQKGGAVFNEKKLDFLNGFYIRQKSPEKLTELCIPYLIEAGLIEESGTLKNETKKLFDNGSNGKMGYSVSETGEGIEIEKITKVISLYQERLKKLSEVSEFTNFFFKDKLSFDKALLNWKQMTEKEIKESLERTEKVLDKIKEADWSKESLESVLLEEAGKDGDRGRLLWPLRAALTGKEASAGPIEVAYVLGRDRTLKRIKEAVELVKR
jgi:glutamyl-tRNA synthetase